MLEEEHPEICQADIEEAKFLQSAREHLRKLESSDVTEIYEQREIAAKPAPMPGYARD